jgi:cell division septation protein DedD
LRDSRQEFARLFFCGISRTNEKIFAWDSGDAVVWKKPGMAVVSLEVGERSMYEVIDEEELTPVERRRDAELTLGPMMVAGLFFGLVLLCGLCFGLGYSMGRGSGHNAPVAGQTTGTGAASPAASSVSKPNAAAQGLPTAVASSADGAVAAQTPGSTTANGANSAQTAPALMVQIAAVSHQEDADVLVEALRKRGFEPTVSSGDDGQLHVRVGPFASLSEANAMREKLTNDGYNAVVQP